MAKWLPAWLGVLVLGSTVHAVPIKVAALLPQLRPTPTNELRDRFHDAVSRGLQGAAEVVNAAEVRLRLSLSSDLSSCVGSVICVNKIASILRVDGLIATDVVATGKSYFIRVQLLDSQGREVSRAEETCEICTLKEADDAAARASAQLSIVSLNKASLLKADGRPEPKPELKAEPKPEPVKTTVTVATRSEPSNAPLISTNAAPSSINPALRWAAIGTAAFGVIGLVVGIPLVAIDGRPTCDKPNPMFSCERIYSTAGGGGTMLALGVASLAASGALFYFDYKQRKKPMIHASLLAGPGGGMLRMDGSF